MANVLANAVPKLLTAFTNVIRNHVGFVHAMNQDFDDKRAAQGQVINIPQPASLSGKDITPSNVTPQGQDSTPGNRTHVLDKGRAYDFHLTGEEERSMMDNAAGFKTTNIETAIGNLIDEIEVDAGIAARLASRATGTPGTTPFASDLSDATALGKILNDNGTPFGGRQLVVGSAELANLQNLNVLQRVNESGGSAGLREGMVGKIIGFDVHYSNFVNSQTIGGASAMLVDGALAAGATSIVVDGDAGTILPGDSITLAGDTNKYMVITGTTGAGTITIGAPGLRQAVIDNAAITVLASAVQSVGFTPEAMALSVRPPALPSGDIGEHIDITDPVTGLTLQFSKYGQYRQVLWEVSAVWGVTNVKPEYSAVLLG